MAVAGSVQFVVHVDKHNVDEMLLRLSAALSDAGIASFLHGMVGPWLQKRAEDRFRAEGDDVTGPWLPLEGYTQQVRQAAGYGAEHPINKRTGEMEAFITGGGWDVISAGGFSELTFPGNFPSAREATKVSTAQMGLSYPSTPARPVLGMNEVDLAYVLAGLSAYVALGTTVKRP